MSKQVIIPSDLGAEFDLGNIESNKIRVDASQIPNLGSSAATAIAGDAAAQEALAEALEDNIEIEDLNTTAPAGSTFVSDGAGSLVQGGQVYGALPTTNVGSPIVSNVDGQNILYSWDGTSYSILGTYESRIAGVLLATDGAGTVDITTLGVTIPQWANAVIVDIFSRAGTSLGTTTSPGTGTIVTINGNNVIDIDTEGSGDHNNAYKELPIGISNSSPNIQYSINKETPGSSASIYISGFKRIY